MAKVKMYDYDRLEKLLQLTGILKEQIDIILKDGTLEIEADGYALAKTSFKGENPIYLDGNKKFYLEKQDKDPENPTAMLFLTEDIKKGSYLLDVKVPPRNG